MNNISIKTDYGSAFGIVDQGDMDMLHDYLSELHFNHEQITEVKSELERLSHGQRFTILMEIHVDANVQGQGHGKELLQKFLKASQASSSGVTLLVCDLDQFQRQGFQLSRFYRAHGFRDLSDQLEDLGVMVKGF